MTRRMIGAEGFTLIEVLTSIAFIALGVLGFALNTMGVIRGNTISGNVTVATSLAQDKMEQLKAQAGWVNVDNCASPENISATGGAGGIYNRCWRITDSPLGSGLKEISVEVSWRDYLNREVVLSTLVFIG